MRPRLGAGLARSYPRFSASTAANRGKDEGCLEPKGGGAMQDEWAAQLDSARIPARLPDGGRLLSGVGANHEGLSKPSSQRE
jgi:hypothetical protein